MSISEVIGWKFSNQEGMTSREVNGKLEISEFPGGIPSQSDQDLWTAEYDLVIAKKSKKRTIRKSANKELKKVIRKLDWGDLKLLSILEPTIDMSKAGNKLVKIIEINRLMLISLKSVKQATTISEVDAVDIPDWP